VAAAAGKTERKEEVEEKAREEVGDGATSFLERRSPMTGRC